MTDLLADAQRLLEIEAELEAMRLRVASCQPAQFNRDNAMLEATIRIGGAASQCRGASTVIIRDVKREMGG